MRTMVGSATEIHARAARERKMLNNAARFACLDDDIRTCRCSCVLLDVGLNNGDTLRTWHTTAAAALTQERPTMRAHALGSLRRRRACLFHRNRAESALQRAAANAGARAPRERRARQDLHRNRARAHRRLRDAVRAKHLEAEGVDALHALDRGRIRRLEPRAEQADDWDGTRRAYSSRASGRSRANSPAKTPASAPKGRRPRRPTTRACASKRSAPRASCGRSCAPPACAATPST